MIGSFGWMELLLILIIVLIIFGAGKIPQLGEGLGKAIKGFKKSVAEADALDVTPNSEESPTQESQPAEQIPPQQAAQAAPPPPPPSEPAQQAEPHQATRQG